MPTHLRALIVILLLAGTVFAFVKATACSLATTTGDFERRRNLWFAITITAFLAHNFWVYIIVTAALLLFAGQRETNKPAMFFFLLLVVPPFAQQISGLGVVKTFFEINYLRLLALTILLPAFWSLHKQPDVVPFGKLLPDKLIAAYLILILSLTLTVSSFTNSLRTGVFYAFIDIFLPYYVMSRSMRSLRDFRDALMAFVIAALAMGIVGIFETVRHWLLYASLDDALGFYWSYAGYLERDGVGLRAQGSTGQPIILGFVIAVAFGCFFYLKKSVPNTMSWLLGLIALVAGLVAPLSRGPWVGAAGMLLVFLAVGPSSVKRLIQLGLVGVIVFAALQLTPFGEKTIALLPFVGTGGDESAVTVTYRQQLLQIGISIALQNPFFGVYSFFLSEEAQMLKQGNGTIDLVNTYLAVVLGNGFVGLFLYLGFFLSVAFGIIKGMRSLASREDENYLLGQTLFATLLGILIMIATVSSILVIPIITWSIAGLCVAYTRMLVTETASATAPESTGRSPGFQSAHMNSRGY